ncbi:MAG: hypothetical protein JWN15_1765 [Firmicutes bacterium]|jgi:hypothetical protein|nr:hypothetical protein [Bacillota bacterium]
MKRTGRYARSFFGPVFEQKLLDGRDVMGMTMHTKGGEGCGEPKEKPHRFRQAGTT